VLADWLREAVRRINETNGRIENILRRLELQSGDRVVP
jgi:hypothetical protein